MEAVPLAIIEDTGGGGGVSAPCTSYDYSRGAKRQRERWSDSEHLLFLEAVKKFGRNWRHIERASPLSPMIQLLRLSCMLTWCRSMNRYAGPQYFWCLKLLDALTTYMTRFVNILHLDEQ